MADEKPKKTEESAPKPVRRTKKVLLDAPVETPALEAAPKLVTKPAAKLSTKAPAAKVPGKTAPKKPAAKPAPKPKPAKAPEPKPAPEPVVAETKEPEKPTEKKAAKKPPKAPAKEKKPAKKGKKPSKKPQKEEEAEEAEEEEEHEARKKPELTEAIRASLRVRREIRRRRPTFYRQEWFRYKRLGLTWRKPQGSQSKLRRHLGYRINVVSIGFRGPKPTRGLHPSGFREVIVHNPAELKGIDPKTQAARIAGGVGGRKRTAIHEAADDLGIRILNRREE
jgi:large subunit ribosomal protein L32e